MNLKLIKKLCQIKAEDLQKILIKYLSNANYQKIQYANNQFIIAEGDLPICLIAHIDTVFSYPPNEFFYDYRKKVLWAPGGSGFDDRAGIYGILQCIEAGFRPHIIFTQGEERGGVGARALTQIFKDCPFQDCRALIELDRANEMDSVFYDCDNQVFETWINSFGFKTDWGTFSDISIIAPIWKIAAVNLSIGYVDEHSSRERLYCDWCDKTIEKVKKILEVSQNMLSYEYVPINYHTKYWNRMSNDIWGSPTEDDFEDESPTTRMKYCLLCSKKLKLGKCHYIPDVEYPYMVCDECFDAYYDADRVYQGGYTENKKDEKLPFD